MRLRDLFRSPELTIEQRGTSEQAVSREPPSVDHRQLASLDGLTTKVDPDAKKGALSGSDRSSWYEDMPGGLDDNPEMSGRLKYVTYREMRNDAAVQSSLWLYKLPLRSATWTLEAPPDDPDGEAAALARMDFAAQNFGLDQHIGWLDLTWDEWLQQTLTFLADGAFGEEIIWADVRTWVDADGDEHWCRPIARFAPRYASTVQDLEWDEVTGLITRIRQDLPNCDWIKGTKLAWYVNEREGANYWGRSMLRSAYYPWKLKKAVLQASAIGYDRWAAGIPHIKHPPGQDNQRRAGRIGMDLRGHERAYVTTEEADLGQPQWEIELLKGADSVADPSPFLRYYDQQIAMAAIQQFSSLGTSEHGSRAVGDVLADPYYLAVQTLARQIAATRMKTGLRRLYDVNFGEHVPIPTLTVSKIQARNIPVLARALADLTSAGFVFTDEDTQNDVREQLDFRRLPDAAARAIEGLPDGVGVGVAPAEGGPVGVAA